MGISKRIDIAMIIDSTIVAFGAGLTQYALNAYNAWVCLIFAVGCVALLFSPLCFRNASVGMKIMKIVIVDENYRYPGAKAIIKRQFTLIILPFRSFREFFKLLYLPESDYNEWELRNTATMTVLKKEQKD